MAVKPTRVAVRPPTPIADQVTARKTSAATKRQSAPSPSRILGTDAALRPRLAGASAGSGTQGRAANGFEVEAVGAAVGVPTTAGAGCLSATRSSSAWLNVTNSCAARCPVRDRPQDGQEDLPCSIVCRQSGHRFGSP